MTEAYPIPAALNALTSQPEASPAARGVMLDTQAAELLRQCDYTPVEDFVLRGLRLGVQRMDVARAEADQPPAFEAAFDTLLADGQRVNERFDAGRQEVATDQSRLRNAPGRTVKLVAEHVDWRLNNPAMAAALHGYTEGTDRIGASFITAGMIGAMQTAGWKAGPLEALTHAFGMNQTAKRQARALAKPLLGQMDTLPRVKLGMEKTYLSSRLFGAGGNEGICYLLGYVDKARPILRAYMDKLWKDDYPENHEIFASTVMMNRKGFKGTDDQKRQAIRNVRRPLYNAIAQDDWEDAGRRLRGLAITDPHVFHPIGLRYFTRPTSQSS